MPLRLLEVRMVSDCQVPSAYIAPNGMKSLDALDSGFRCTVQRTNLAV
jgi:hypothetical protein